MKANTPTIALLVLAGLLSQGCATSRSYAGTKVQDADEKMVAGCAYLKDVEGSSGWGGLASSVGMQNARNAAADKAAKLGATHIVWLSVSGGTSPFVSGRAYKCPEAAK